MAHFPLDWNRLEERSWVPTFQLKQKGGLDLYASLLSLAGHAYCFHICPGVREAKYVDVNVHSGSTHRHFGDSGSTRRLYKGSDSPPEQTRGWK